jgi:aspartate dehydrogenase
MKQAAQLTVAIAGLGSIGLAVAKGIDRGAIAGMALAAVAARDGARARAQLASFRTSPALVPLAALAETADVILECLPARHFLEVAEPAIARGRLFMPLSVGALIDHMQLIALARETGARIIVPTGALLGLDAVRAAAEGRIASVSLLTRKPPASLAGAPGLEESLAARGLSLAGLQQPLRVFSGSAREAIARFPANLNVAVALALAGIGPDRTQVEVWADPAVARNTHTVRVAADAADLTMTIENVPSSENPRTGRITAQSALCALRRLTAPLVVGS